MDDAEDHEAVQGLLDLTERASAEAAQPALPSRGATATAAGQDGDNVPPSASQAVPAAKSRLVTSGNTPPSVKRSRPAARLFKEPELKADPAPPPPPSAFALIGSGDSGKSSAEFTPFASTTARETASGSDGETESDDKGKQLLKKRRLTREVSINTVLARVGSKEPPLADVLGRAPQTVQEIIPPTTLARSPAGRQEPSADTLSLVNRLWGRAPAAQAPSLPRPLAAASSLERDLHLPPVPQLVLGSTPASEPAPAALANGKHEPAAAEVARTALWKGRVKHRLRTTEGASVVELFALQALVPERLLEHMPPTLFVSTLAARASVKLGKHYVVQCCLDALSERQRQKAQTLAAMRLVAVCELQHCTLSLVPFTDRHQGLRLVGFMIADD